MWYQLQIGPCPKDKAPFFSDMLENSGAVSLTLRDKNDDAIFEPEIGTTPLWPEVIIEALFQEAQVAESLSDFLKAIHPELTISLQEIKEEDWEKTSRDHFQAISCGKRLWICPSWLVPPEPQACNLILDPGLAFGTGSHPTTHLCLQYLDQANLEDKTLIDYGCGSGILALAALKLGAKKAYALDIDPQALIATQNNAAINGITEAQLELGLVEDLPIAVQVDLILANILLTPLIGLGPVFDAFLKEEGKLVVSGILQGQKEELIAAYQGQFKVLEAKDLGDWSLLVFGK